MKHTAYIALGSNLGDRSANISQAVHLLARAEEVWINHAADMASVYETAPLDCPRESPPFLNTVVRLRTTYSPRRLFKICVAIEKRLGRVRSTRHAPRTIDLDLLLYDDRIIREPDLTIPHPRLHQRPFVLEPLCELAGALVHPVLGETIETLARRARHRCTSDGARHSQAANARTPVAFTLTPS